MRALVFALILPSLALAETPAYTPPPLPHIGPSATVTAAAPAPAPAPEPAAPVTPEEKPVPPAFVPMYQFHWSEGASMPNIGSLFFGNNIGTTVGGRWAFTPGQALYSSYELGYTGPGLRGQEGQEFGQRSIDHQVSFGHEWSPVSTLALGSRAYYQRQMRRSGSNEAFGTGLYDYWSLGLAERADFKLDHVAVGGSLGYAHVTFPNYTDLLREFQSASSSSEQSGGLQDYNRLSVVVDTKFLQRGTAHLNATWLVFTNAKVVTPAGTLGDEAQLDAVYEVGASWAQVLAGDEHSSVLAVAPAFNLAVKRSNQNFLRFKSFGDTSPTFIERNYDYLSPTLSAPLTWSFKSGTMLFLSPSWSMVAYANRPPRDTGNSYLTGKTQTNSTFILTTGVGTTWHRFARVTFGYTLHVQQSNNRFERFLPYNYVGHVLFTSLDLAY